jgi:hypothetical protein
MSDLGLLLLLLVIVGPSLYALPGRVGGWRGILHPRQREPVGAVLLGLLLIGLGIGIIALSLWPAFGVLTIAFGLVITLIAQMMLRSAIEERELEVGDLSDELDKILDPTESHFVVDEHNAHRPLELLEELSALIGPGMFAPGHRWATHEWVAARREAALAARHKGLPP